MRKSNPSHEALSGRPILALGVLLLLLLPTPAAHATPLEANLDDIKVAYLYRLLEFVQWPEREPPLVREICTLGNSSIDPLLPEIAGKVSGRSQVIAHPCRTSEALKRCHLLYVPERLDAAATQLLQQADSSTTLIVRDESAAEEKGHIFFHYRDRRLRLSINLSHVEQSELRISARLLQVVQRIGGETP